jgi:DNA replication protein DnaC
MAEIALASSVAGLLSLAIQVADISHRYFSSVKSSSKTIKGYFRELEVLKLVLRKFDDLAKDPNTATHFSSENITVVDGCREELEDLRSKLHKRSSDPTFPKPLNRLTWPFAEDETQRLVAVIHRYQASFHAVLSADHFKLNVETLAEINKSTTEDAQENLRTLVAWISPANPTSNHVTAREKHESMTGRWLLDSKTFAQWSTARQSSMWIYGIPGAGKTILCSTVIDSLLQHRQVGDAVAFFYFDYMDEQKQTLEAAIRSLISQLWSSYSEVPETIRRLWRSNQGPYRKGLLSNRELIDCFKGSCKGFGKVQVVLDALDESSDRAPLLAFLEEMVKHSDGNIQLIVTSRHEQDIEETLMTLFLHPVSLDNKFVAADIRRHVHSSLEHDRKLKRMPTKLKHRIEDVLTQKAHGM